MELSQYFKLFLLLLLVSCSEQTEQDSQDGIDYSKEFESVVNEFSKSTILEFDESNYLDEAFVKDFLKKLDPQKTVFIQQDIDNIIKLIDTSDSYQVLKKSIDKYYERFNESISFRTALLKFYKFNFDRDEYIYLNPRDNY